jgi:hypothetical protein
VPSEEHLQKLARLYPGIRVEVHATPGRKLSNELQDGQSYRYGIVNLGGRDRADVLQTFEACREKLGIVLRPLEPLQGEEPRDVEARSGSDVLRVLASA